MPTRLHMAPDYNGYRARETGAPNENIVQKHSTGKRILVFKR